MVFKVQNPNVASERLLVCMWCDPEGAKYLLDGSIALPSGKKVIRFGLA